MINFLKKRFKLILILAGIVIIALFFYQNNISAKKTKTKQTTKVTRGDLVSLLTIPGEIDAYEKTTLKFQTSGRLTWVGVTEGDFVKKYQGIAALDSREVKKKLEKELNDYLTARANFDQTIRDDYKDKFITDSIRRILNKSQYDLNSSVLDVEIQNLAVESSYLWSPIEGIVTRVGTPFAGVNITPTNAEFDIVNPSTVYFVGTADQTEVIKLKEGLSGVLILDAFPEEKLTGVIQKMGFTPKSGESSTVYEIKFVFQNDNSNYKYRLGMTGDLTFTTEKKESVLNIPSKYLKEKNGKKYVLSKIDGKLEDKVVETGMETENSVEVVSGLSEDDVISE